MTQNFYSVTGLFAPFLRIDPTVGIVTLTLVVSGVVVYSIWASSQKAITLPQVNRGSNPSPTFNTSNEITEVFTKGWTQFNDHIKERADYMDSPTEFIKKFERSIAASIGQKSDPSVFDAMNQAKKEEIRGKVVEELNKNLLEPIWRLASKDYFDRSLSCPGFFRNMGHHVVSQVSHNFDIVVNIGSSFLRSNIHYIMIYPWETAVGIRIFIALPAIFQILWMAIYCNSVVVPAYVTLFKHNTGQLVFTSNVAARYTSWSPEVRYFQWLPWSENPYCLDSALNFSISLIIGGTLLGLISTTYFAIFTQHYHGQYFVNIKKEPNPTKEIPFRNLPYVSRRRQPLLTKGRYKSNLLYIQ